MGKFQPPVYAMQSQELWGFQIQCINMDFRALGKKKMLGYARSQNLHCEMVLRL